MADATAYEVCRQLITDLDKLGATVRKDDMIAQLWSHPLITDQALERYLASPESLDMVADGQFIHAPPTEMGSPVLWPVIALTVSEVVAGIREVTAIRVALFHESENTPHATAWRFEAPHGDTGEGSHDYHHVQPILDWAPDGSGPELPPHRSPLNTSCPAFPIPADDSVDLVLALLLSLYGMGWLKRRSSAMAECVRGEVGRRMNRLTG